MPAGPRPRPAPAHTARAHPPAHTHPLPHTPTHAHVQDGRIGEVGGDVAWLLSEFEPLRVRPLRRLCLCGMADGCVVWQMDVWYGRWMCGMADGCVVW